MRSSALCVSVDGMVRRKFLGILWGLVELLKRSLGGFWGRGEGGGGKGGGEGAGGIVLGFYGCFGFWCWGGGVCCYFWVFFRNGVSLVVVSEVVGVAGKL